MRALAPAALAFALVASRTARAEPRAQRGQTFTPESFLVPVRSVVLATIDPQRGSAWSGGAPLYTCAADDCYVDMADDAALGALFATPAEVPEGSYNAIVMNNCVTEGAFFAKVKGTVAYEGVTYYTAPGERPLSTSTSDHGYASIRYQGCSGPLMLPRPVQVKTGDALAIDAFFTLEGLSWLMAESAPGMGGCAAGATSPTLCSGLPTLVGYVGDVAPRLETYLVTEDPLDLAGAKAGGSIILLANDDGAFAGFLRRVYSPTSLAPSAPFDVPLRSVTPSSPSDGGAASYTLTSYGEPADDPTRYAARWPAFVRGDHTGVMHLASGQRSLPYRAVRR